MRTTRSATYPLALISLSALAVFLLLDSLFFDMAFLQRAKGFFRAQASRTDEWDVTGGNDSGVDRAIYWKADFGSHVEVTKNFYHELGNHG